MKAQTKNLVTVRDYFQQHFIDTNAIPQKFLNEYRGKVFGNSPEDTRTQCVGDLTFEFQGRRPKPSKVKSLLKKEGGINLTMLGSIQLANIEDREEELSDIWNGLHRAMMTCIVQGPDAEVPVDVTKFANGKEVHSIFWKSQGSRATNTTKEQNFISQIKSTLPEAETESVFNLLSNTNDVVIFEDAEIYEPVKNSIAWQVKVAPCVDMLKDTKGIHGNILLAFEIYKSTFTHSYGAKPKTPKMMNSQVVKALNLIFEKNPAFFEGSTKTMQGTTEDNIDLFEKWLAKAVEFTPSIEKNWLHKEYPHDRMEKRHFGTALGIWEKFVNYWTLSVSTGGKHRPLLKTMESVYIDSLPKKA